MIIFYKKITVRIRGKIIKSVIRSTMIFGLKAEPMIKKQKSELEVT